MKKTIVYLLNGLAYLMLTTSSMCCDFDFDSEREESLLYEHDQKLLDRNPDYITRRHSVEVLQVYLDSVNPIWNSSTNQRLEVSMYIDQHKDYFLTNEARAEWLPFIRVVPEDKGRGFFIVPASRLMHDSIAPVLYYQDSLDCDSHQLRKVVESTSHYLSSGALGEISMSEWTLEDRKEALRLVGINMNWKLTEE